jgi:hypothetical protein
MSESCKNKVTESEQSESIPLSSFVHTQMQAPSVILLLGKAEEQRDKTTQDET